MENTETKKTEEKPTVVSFLIDGEKSSIEVNSKGDLLVKGVVVANNKDMADNLFNFITEMKMAEDVINAISKNARDEKAQ